MASEAGCMCITARRYRESNASIGRFMAGRTIYVSVPRVVEPSAKGAKPRETLHRTTARICMTDRTDRARIIRELQRVTPDARRMTVAAGKAYAGRVRIASMTKQARHAGVICVAMREARVILVLCSRRDRRFFFDGQLCRPLIAAPRPDIARRSAYRDDQKNV